MYEILLKLLGEQFSKARKDGLSHLARSLALQVADETEAKTLVEKINETQVTDFIKAWRSEVDSEVSKSNSTYEENLKTKYDFVDKQPEKKPDLKTDDPKDISAIIADALEKAIKPLHEKISFLESSKTVDTRKQSLSKIIESAPDAFKNSILKNFSKMSFDNDEDFNEFLTDTEADVKIYEQEDANSGLNQFPKPTQSTKVAAEAVDKDIANWAKSNIVE